MKQITLNGKSYPVKTELSNADKEAIALNDEAVCQGGEEYFLEEYFLMCRANLAILAPSTMKDETSFNRDEVMHLWAQASALFIEMMHHEAAISGRLANAQKRLAAACDAHVQRRNQTERMLN